MLVMLVVKLEGVCRKSKSTHGILLMMTIPVYMPCCR